MLSDAHNGNAETSNEFSHLSPQTTPTLQSTTTHAKVRERLLHQHLTDAELSISHARTPYISTCPATLTRAGSDLLQHCYSDSRICTRFFTQHAYTTRIHHIPHTRTHTHTISCILAWTVFPTGTVPFSSRTTVEVVRCSLFATDVLTLALLVFHTSG